MAKAGDIRVDEDGKVYKYVDGDWVFIGEVYVTGDIPSVGPAIQTFEPRTYPVEDAGGIISALWPGDPGAWDKFMAIGAAVAPKTTKATKGEGSELPSNLVELRKMSDALTDITGEEFPVETVNALIQYIYPDLDPDDAVDKFVKDYGYAGGQALSFQAGGPWVAALENAYTRWQSSAAGGGGGDGEGTNWWEDQNILAGLGLGGGEETAGLELPGGLMDFARSLLQPGGPGTAGGFYTAIGDIATPLAGADELEFLNRFAQPGQYYPSSFYTLMNKALMPMGLNMPGEVFSLMSSAFPSGIAPGTPSPDFSFLSGLGAAPAPALGNFLASLVQGNPELGVALMEAAIGMQQEYAAPYLPLLMGPAAAEGGGISGPDFLAAILGGLA